LVIVAFAAVPGLPNAQDAGAARAEGASAESPVRAMHGGILPPEEYGGELGKRRYLLGDWGGTRTDLADKGIRFRGSLTPSVQGVVDGGADETSAFGVSGDLWSALDLDRMGLVRGGLLVARAEFDTGRTINNKSGTIMAPSYNALFPVSGEAGRDVFSLTNLYYTQFLGERFGVWLGRTDTFHNASLNEFAGLNPRAGKSQFMNLALTGSPVMPITQPYVTSLGAGFFARPADDWELAGMVMDSRESSLTDGLSDFGRDWNAFAAVARRHRIGNLPGRNMVAFSYSWNGDYTNLDGGQLSNIVSGTPLDRQDDTWALIYSGFQYLQVFDGDTSKPVNLKDGRVDHRGWGVFVMAGLADKDTNPVQWSIAAGIGGRGLFPSRPDDEFGIGYFHVDLKSGVVANIIGLESAEQGVEIYYQFEVIPSVHVTPDIQIVDPGLAGIDTAVVLGLRTNITF
jgi:porin